MKRIYIVEDEIKLRKELKCLLEKNGYKCTYSEDFNNTIEDILKDTPDLVLLDLSLPVYDGFYICRKIRENLNIPIIIVTSSDRDIDELMSLNLGADDFITKPYNVHILLARISAVLLRTCGHQSHTVLTHKGLSLNISKSKASYQGYTVDLTKNELGILRLLMERNGTIVSREDLICELWEMDEFVEDSTLTVNINRLRKKLEDVCLLDYLITKRGQGYMV